MVCGKCKWWSGLLVVGECMWPRSMQYLKTTLHIDQCKGDMAMQIYPDLLDNPNNDPRVTQQQYEAWYREQVELEEHEKTDAEEE